MPVSVKRSVFSGSRAPPIPRGDFLFFILTYLPYAVKRTEAASAFGAENRPLSCFPRANPSMRRVFSKSSFHAESSHFCFIPITSLLHPRAIIPHTQGWKGGTQHGEANFLSGGGLLPLGFMLLPAANESAQTVSVAVGSNSPAADDASAAGQLLFPELSDTDITGIRIHANDDCEFDFSVRGELSVNGQKADEEVLLRRLVDQLTADSFTLCDDFEPQNGSRCSPSRSTRTRRIFPPAFIRIRETANTPTSSPARRTSAF